MNCFSLPTPSDRSATPSCPNLTSDALPTLTPGDTILLEKYQDDGWWIIKLNNNSFKILIKEFEAIEEIKLDDESLSSSVDKEDSYLSLSPFNSPSQLSRPSSNSTSSPMSHIHRGFEIGGLTPTAHEKLPPFRSHASASFSHGHTKHVKKDPVQFNASNMDTTTVYNRAERIHTLSCAPSRPLPPAPSQSLSPAPSQPLPPVPSQPLPPPPPLPHDASHHSPSNNSRSVDEEKEKRSKKILRISKVYLEGMVKSKKKNDHTSQPSISNTNNDEKSFGDDLRSLSHSNSAYRLMKRSQSDCLLSGNLNINPNITLHKSGQVHNQNYGDVQSLHYSDDNYVTEFDTRHIRSKIKSELARVQNDVEVLKINMQLLVRTANELCFESIDDLLLVEDSPEERILKKMLEAPFCPMFKLAGGKDTSHDESMAMAPVRSTMYYEILLPHLNVNSVSEAKRKLLRTLEFDLFPFKEKNDESKMHLFLMTMFYELNLVQYFRIPELTLIRFLIMVSRKYRTVPFHNFYHAFNVTQTMYYFLVSCKARYLFGPLELLALLVSAMSHDCDHPGLNNDFQRKAQTRVYHMHKKSVLENHHYLTCMSLLAKPETNILVNLTPDQDEQIYIYLRDLILATDMAVHGLIVKNLLDRKKVLSKVFKMGPVCSQISDEDRKLLMVSLIKCSDLSNEIREERISKRWAKLVIAEFIAQSDKERDLNLPVTPFMDRDKIIIAKEQVNFIEKLCLPLYTQLAAILPDLEKCCYTMEKHRDDWQQHLKLFFTDHPNDLKKLSNKSIWERDQVKQKGSTLSSTLAMRASSSQIPKRQKINHAISNMHIKT